MPGSLVFAIVCVVAAGIAFAVAGVIRRPQVRLGAIGLLALAVIFVFVAAFKQVGTKEVGIETSFGKTVGHLSNGPHLTWPWVAVHEMDAAIQTDSHTGPDCIPVRVANQQTGCASVSFQWRIRPNAADELYRDYRSFVHVQDALVTRRLTAAVNAAFETYNPLNAIAAGTGSGIPSAGKAESLSAIAKRISGEMRGEVGGRIEVISTILPLITFDQATQDRINQLQQQVAQTRIAIQERQTNEELAKANAALAKSVNTSPNVLVSRCLDILEKMVNQKEPVPAGFSCWQGSGVAGVIAK